MYLREAVNAYLLYRCTASRDGHKLMQRFRPVLQRLSDFACNMPVSELEPIHILMFVSAEKIIGIRQGENPASELYLRHYIIIRLFVLWLEKQDLVKIDMMPFLQKVLGDEKVPGDENPKKNTQHPPVEGGCWVYNGPFALSFA